MIISLYFAATCTVHSGQFRGHLFCSHNAIMSAQPMYTQQQYPNSLTRLHLLIQWTI